MPSSNVFCRRASTLEMSSFVAVITRLSVRYIKMIPMATSIMGKPGMDTSSRIVGVHTQDFLESRRKFRFEVAVFSPCRAGLFSIAVPCPAFALSLFHLLRTIHSENLYRDLRAPLRHSARLQGNSKHPALTKKPTFILSAEDTK